MAIPGSFLVLSDLHLGGERSYLTPAALRPLLRRFQSVETVVINGDLLDLADGLTLPQRKRNSLLDARAIGLVRSRLEGAIATVRMILKRTPGTTIHYTIGNRDWFPELLEQLKALEKDYPNFHVHEHEVRLGDALFIHGDQLMPGLRVANYAELMISERMGGETPGHEETQVYAMMCDQLQARGYSLEGVSRLFVGHLHLPLEDYRLPGTEVTVYNTGAFCKERDALIFTGTVVDGKVTSLQREKIAAPDVSVLRR